jgi:hypothetical protein
LAQVAESKKTAIALNPHRGSSVTPRLHSWRQLHEFLRLWR